MFLVPVIEMSTLKAFVHGLSPHHVHGSHKSARFYFLPWNQYFEATPVDTNTVNIKGVAIGGANPVRIMGVVNLSPESFYKGSVVLDKDDLQGRVRLIEKQGGNIIDIGGASTAPRELYGTPSINEDEELSRVTFAMDIVPKITGLPISIDTTSAVIAERALEMGASAVNDVSGLRHDPRMAHLVADWHVPVVIMAACSGGCSSVEDSLRELSVSIKIADEAGILREDIILDPGIGFGKPARVDFQILRELDKYMLFGRPLLVGVSRKAFIGSLLGEPNPEDRLAGTIAATTVAVVNGASAIRAHDVTEAVIAARVGEALRSSQDSSGHNL
jgi:dihydropteroate synthase